MSMKESLEEKDKIFLQMQKVLKNNKIIVDKYLNIEYNMSLMALVREDDDRERGKALFIEKLRKLMDQA